MKHKKRVEKIEQQIRRIGGGSNYTVILPTAADWENPKPLTDQVITQKLRAMQTGEILLLVGAGRFYKYADDPESVICLSRSAPPPGQDYNQKPPPAAGFGTSPFGTSPFGETPGHKK